MSTLLIGATISEFSDILLILKFFSSGPDDISLRKPKVFALQILRRYLRKEGRIRKFFYNLIWIKEPCVRKVEGLVRSKILGISQTNM